MGPPGGHGGGGTNPVLFILAGIAFLWLGIGLALPLLGVGSR
jgi:hypothetical protein